MQRRPGEKMQRVENEKKGKEEKGKVARSETAKGDEVTCAAMNLLVTMMRMMEGRTTTEYIARTRKGMKVRKRTMRGEGICHF